MNSTDAVYRLQDVGLHALLSYEFNDSMDIGYDCCISQEYTPGSIIETRDNYNPIMLVIQTYRKPDPPPAQTTIVEETGTTTADGPVDEETEPSESSDASQADS